MALISQETWDNMPREEKARIIAEYNYKATRTGKVEYEILFGKENLEAEPEIRAWEDLEKDGFCVEKDCLRELDDWDTCIEAILFKGSFPDKSIRKVIATLKIAKLIELGYGGVVTEEDKQSDTGYYVIYPVLGYGELQVVWSINTNVVGRDFIAFHTQQQAEEFMSYESNRKLIEQYNML